eukprot:PITA_30972
MLKSLLPGWVFIAMDASGHSGGLAIGFEEGRVKVINHWGMKNVLGMEVLSPDFTFPITLVNIYGPCQGREPFWEELMTKTVMKSPLMILGGDLNFSLGRAEAWGPFAREDPLSDFFFNLVTENNLIGPSPIKLKPTWRNRKIGEDRIAKRLDRFLFAESLSSKVPMIRQWVEEIGNSDHFPIFLDLTIPPHKPPAPFKFNPAWLQVPSFYNMFKETWIHPDQNAGEDKSFLFMENLKRLKKATISWAKDRKLKQNEEMISIREELKQMENQGEATIAEVFSTVQSFPRFIEEDEAEDLTIPVTKEEIEAAMKLMGKDKSPGPDGWTIELFLHFFEQIGAEITEVVEESRLKGVIYRPFNSTFISLIPKKDDPESFEDFRPISLCNCIYKIISKVIALRIAPILSRNISMEQFGFLDGRQIHEAIGVAQEVIHSVKMKKKKGFVLKIELSKAYDRISWLYLRMLLTHVGFSYPFVS